MPALLEWVPEDFRVYHEPFLGSGALFFTLTHWHPKLRAILSDANTRLTRTFNAIQQDVEAVLPPLRIYAEMYEKHGAAFYLHARDSIDPDLLSDPEMAAWFIFTNKTGFNGLWRVNKSGKYNVPPGRFASPPVVCDEPLLRACSAALTSALIVNSDFRTVEQRAQPGDLVYFDPVYAPVSTTSNFTSYTAGGFSTKDQRDLRDLALRLKRRDVRVLLSNSDAPLIRELYTSPNFECRELARSGTINSDRMKRQAVRELLIR